MNTYVVERLIAKLVHEERFDRVEAARWLLLWQNNGMGVSDSVGNDALATCLTRYFLASQRAKDLPERCCVCDASMTPDVSAHLRLPERLQVRFIARI